MMESFIQPRVLPGFIRMPEFSFAAGGPGSLPPERRQALGLANRIISDYDRLQVRLTRQPDPTKQQQLKNSYMNALVETLSYSIPKLPTGARDTTTAHNIANSILTINQTKTDEASTRPDDEDAIRESWKKDIADLLEPEMYVPPAPPTTPARPFVVAPTAPVAPQPPVSAPAAVVVRPPWRERITTPVVTVWNNRRPGCLTGVAVVAALGVGLVGAWGIGRMPVDTTLDTGECATLNAGGMALGYNGMQLRRDGTENYTTLTAPDPDHTLFTVDIQDNGTEVCAGKDNPATTITNLFWPDPGAIDSETNSVVDDLRQNGCSDGCTTITPYSTNQLP